MNPSCSCNQAQRTLEASCSSAAMLTLHPSFKNLGFNQNRILINRSGSKLQKLSSSYLRIGRDNTRNHKGENFILIC
ncbi:hypothetical protein ACHQM5_025838 [Ranunculus cassubicifolius]